MFQANSLQFSRDNRVLFHNFSLAVQGGQGVVLTGDNGAGKTTLLKILAGLIQPQQGEVLFQSENIQESTQFAQARYFMSHQLGLKNSFTAAQMVTFFMAFRGIASESTAVLNMFGLGALSEQPIKSFSAGQKQKLALSLAFAAQAKLLLLDEPTSNLDASGLRAFTEAINLHLEKGRMLVFSSHDPKHFSHLPVQVCNIAGGQHAH